MIVPRERPTVSRLESLPLDASYPVRAHGSVAGALRRLAAPPDFTGAKHDRSPSSHGIGIVAIPLFVGWARMYRGMHHLTDTAAGLLLGIGALLVVVFATRAAGATRRAERRAPDEAQHEEHRGNRTRSEVDRRRPRRASAVPQRTRASPIRSGARCRRAACAPKRVEAALEDGAELVLAWGGDGMVQRCIDVLAGTGVPLAIVPAGTANLFASSLDVPQDIQKAVQIAPAR